MASTDPGLIAEWTRFVEETYAVAEDIAAYFDRAVAALAPPPLTGG